MSDIINDRPSAQLRALLVEDCPEDGELIVRALAHEGVSVVGQRVDTLESLREALETKRFDVVLVDCKLPGFSGLQALILVREMALDVPVIVVSGSVGEETAADLMRAGARDYVSKHRLARLAPAVRREVGEARARAERRAADEQLRMQQQRFQALVERSSEAISVLDAAGIVTYGSPSTERVLGYRVEQFVGRSAFEYIDPADVDVARRTLAEVLAMPGATREAVLCCRHRSGERRWLDLTARNLLDDPAIRGIVVNYRDVTEERVAQDKLSDREALYRSTFDEAPIGIVHTALDGRFLQANQEFSRFIGYSPAELPSVGLMDVTLAEDRASDFHSIAELVAGRQQRHTRVKQYRRKDGRLVSARRTVSVRRDPNGEPLHLIAIVEDLTQQLETEKSLRELQSRFQAILDHSPALIYLKDLEGRYVLANRLFREKFAACGKDLIGRRADEVLDQTAAAAVANHDAAVLARGEPVANELEVEEVDGRHVYFSQKFILRGTDGVALGIGAIAIDVTDRRRIQQQLVQAQKMEAFGQLAGGVAHDFNNILAVLLMHFNLMPVQAELPATTRATLKQLEQVVNRASSLVRQLLIFSRRHEVSKETLDLNRTVEGVCKMLHRLVGEHIAFNFRAHHQPVPIRADARMMEQVVMNLCVNARDAMPHGGSLTVTVGCAYRRRGAGTGQPAQSFAVLSVCDTGHGMDEATKRRIFEPFFTTKPVGHGTGLGLATVDGIVKEHEGWVEVDSVLRQGTTFRVYLPVAPGRAAEPELASPAIVRGQGRILLVEDDAAVRYVTATGLRMAGYEVIEATNAMEAEERWNTGGPFDLLLTDMVMPGSVTGEELAEHLCGRAPTLPVILMSGYNATVSENALSPNATRIPKPFSLATMLDLVRSKLTASAPLPS